MSTDRFHCASLEHMLQWLLTDLEHGEALGIPQGLFLTPSATDPFRMERYGRLLETPLGVAAGPHTQLSQNIVAAWLCGARYMELKTIQVLDELEVTKPCIDMTDEGYNCEWSQELKLDQSFEEYLNAHILLHVLSHRLGRSYDPQNPGWIFNMSAGYNLEGILSPTVQRFLDRMEDCTEELGKKIDSIAHIYPAVRDLEIPATLSNNLTVSTMHGCPPDEVEKIGRYFIETRGYHTTIKLNPTLLGPEQLRGILNTTLGFEVTVPDEAFGHDLKYDQGVSIIKNLTEAAKKKGVAFGLKLTNTLETSNIDQNLPKNESMVYMSGRALHPISINLAARLQKEFSGTLDISFSAGIDAMNIADTLGCGLRPVTVSSDLLKPGGYGRLSQYAENIRTVCMELGATNLDDLVTNKAQISDMPKARMANLQKYAQDVLDSGRYNKEEFPYTSIKTKRDLPSFDCASAPCMSVCPTAQDIPRYLDCVARGDDEGAYRTILATNPFPHMQGKVCDHLCQYKCTRMNYDATLLIREIKRFAAEQCHGSVSLKKAAPNGKKVAIIGSGPTGLSAAYFLTLAGCEVTIYESKAFAGGMAADGIPAFRLDDGSLKKDIDFILAQGATLHTNYPIDQDGFQALVQQNDYVYIAVGAQGSARLDIPGAEARGVLDQLGFLSMVRQGATVRLGSKVAIIGAGNSAMDAARTAKRLVGNTGEVNIVYRRTRAQMPADKHEIAEALEEGIGIIELAAPKSVETKAGNVSALEVVRMELGEPDESGRRSPKPVPNSTYRIEAESIIVAIGQRIELDFLPDGALNVDMDTMQTDKEKVFAGGDVARGASSLIKAIADGRRAAGSILQAANLDQRADVGEQAPRKADIEALQIRQARKEFGPAIPEKGPSERMNFDLFVDTLSEKDARAEAKRCLQCDLICNICTTVCPNRANFAIAASPMEYPVQEARIADSKTVVHTLYAQKMQQAYQIINIADYCNECGNCATFCPTSGAPYIDKPKVHLTPQSFSEAASGYHFITPALLKAKSDGTERTLEDKESIFIYEDNAVRVEFDKDSLEARTAQIKNGMTAVDLSPASEMMVLHRLLAQYAPFTEKA